MVLVDFLCTDQSGQKRRPALVVSAEPYHRARHEVIVAAITSNTERRRYCKKLLDDPLVMFFDRTVMLWFGLGLLIPYLIAGWPGLLWGGLIRCGFHNHLTFSVNSVCHTFGDRPFATADESRNNWLIGLLAFGEGWHNNHHAFPAMAYHGMGWRQVDLSGLLIRALVRLGLAWDVKQPSPALIERRKRRSPRSSAEPVARTGR